MAPCLDELRLARFASGDADDVELSEIESHIDSCTDCRRAVAAAVSTHTAPRSPASSVLASGTIVGRYRVERLLGSGGMGVVYEAADPQLGRKVALKLLRSADELGSNDRLLREAQTMARLAHPNLVPLFELGEWQGRVFLAMELVDGVSLGAWRAEQARSSAELLRVLMEAGRGLSAAHRAGVVHRDFKPANVLVGSDGRARVSDFGLCRVLEPAAVVPDASSSMLQTQAGALLGTPAYMSPEQLAGRPADAKSDQFSFCVTVVEALTGARPFVGKSAEELREAMTRPPALKGVPQRIRSVIARGLRIDPAERFASMDELLAALDAKGRSRRAVLIAGMLGLAGVGIALFARGEPQVEVMAAAVNLREGQIVTADQMVIRKIPKSLFTSSVVRPEHAGYVIGHPLMIPVQAGDVFLWSHFEAMPRDRDAGR